MRGAQVEPLQRVLHRPGGQNRQHRGHHALHLLEAHALLGQHAQVLGGLAQLVFRTQGAAQRAAQRLIERLLLRQDAVHAARDHLLGQFQREDAAIRALAAHQPVGIGQAGVQQDEVAVGVGHIFKGRLEIPARDPHGARAFLAHDVMHEKADGLRGVQKPRDVEQPVNRRVIAQKPLPRRRRFLRADGARQRVVQRPGQKQRPVVAVGMEAAPQTADQRLRRAQVVPVAQKQLAVVDEQALHQLHLARADIQRLQRQALAHRRAQRLQRRQRMAAPAAHVVKRPRQQRLRVRLGGFRRKQAHARMGKKAALACLKLFFTHHAHGHFAPIGMKGHLSEHTAPPLSPLLRRFYFRWTTQPMGSSVLPNWMPVSTS